MDFKLKGSESVLVKHDESNDTHTNVAAPGYLHNICRFARTIGVRHFFPANGHYLCSSHRYEIKR